MSCTLLNCSSRVRSFAKNSSLRVEAPSPAARDRGDRTSAIAAATPTAIIVTDSRLVILHPPVRNASIGLSRKYIAGIVSRPHEPPALRSVEYRALSLVA